MWPWRDPPSSEGDLDAREPQASRPAAGGFSGIWIATAVLFLVSGLLSPNTLGATSILSMLPFAAVLAIAAMGETLVIQQRGLDLSVPGMMSLSAVIVSKYSSTHGGELLVPVVLSLVAGLIVGSANGVLISRFRVTPLIATLAVNALLVGAVRSYSGGHPSQAPEALSEFALGKTVGIPNTVLVAVVLVALVAWVIRSTVVGRRFVGAGASPTAARAAGLRLRRYQIGTFAVAGLCYAVAGTLLAGYVETPGLTIGDAYLFPVFAAVVVGGTPLMGGRGSVVATAVAALFLSQLQQLVLALGAPTSVQLLVQAVAIAGAVIVREWTVRRGSARRLERRTVAT
jgi:ribose transport system permease protein